MSTITITPAQLQSIVNQAVNKAVRVQQPAHAHHTKKVVIEEWSSEEESEVATKKNKAVKKVVPKAKKNKVVKSDDGRYTATKLKTSIAYGCDCPTRDEEDCNSAAWYELHDHPTYDHACAQHWSMIKEGKHIGAKPKKNNPICSGTTKKGKDCKKFAMDGELYCYQHIDDDSSE